MSSRIAPEWIRMLKGLAGFCFGTGEFLGPTTLLMFNTVFCPYVCLPHSFTPTLMTMCLEHLYLHLVTEGVSCQVCHGNHDHQDHQHLTINHSLWHNQPLTHRTGTNNMYWLYFIILASHGILIAKLLSVHDYTHEIAVNNCLQRDQCKSKRN